MLGGLGKAGKLRTKKECLIFVGARRAAGRTVGCRGCRPGGYRRYLGASPHSPRLGVGTPSRSPPRTSFSSLLLFFPLSSRTPSAGSSWLMLCPTRLNSGVTLFLNSSSPDLFRLRRKSTRGITVTVFG